MLWILSKGCPMRACYETLLDSDGVRSVYGLESVRKDSKFRVHGMNCS